MGLQLAAAGLLTALATSTAFASGTAFVSQASQHGFNATVSALKRSVASNGLMVMGKINQKQILSMTGLQLKGAESFLVGNPSAGKKLFAMDPAVGAVIPARIYVWVKGGTTYVGYFEPSQLMRSINPKLAMPGKMMDKKFAAIARNATQ
ncbi:hypothetical protein BI364_08305 [Acidihalobacter yilgarnensis]|uniref:DUF302 domain-containing protein n=1 Tax=Acidihalobacter yilgarnensis TaxID=2819280 RepID=A0A1D8INF5_9GAMM|nr:DUF302 domain-containing protein [Acidihalobacter yilgarnensis]AOU97965.1 hypothetical protein BI364_08305 [Acidihalobacter yilgarnensis]